MYILSHPDKIIRGHIVLTSSKSISNRLLIIQALCNQPFSITNLATAQDTQTLQQLLQQYKQGGTLDVGPAGTVMRFMTAFLAVSKGAWQLTGSERMKQRPIAPLVAALQSLGAHIDYVEQANFPPFHIQGKALQGGAVSILGNVSSQFISALLLVGPALTQGLRLTITNELTSKSYVDMTMALMQHCGAVVHWKDNVIDVKPQPYSYTGSMVVEADWSAASYWYAIVALSKDATLRVDGLSENSLQGDAVLVDIFKRLGVATTFTPDGVQLHKITVNDDFFDYDFSNCPDIAQTVAVVICALGLKGRLSGLHTLKVKETDRITALVTELTKLGYHLEAMPNDEIYIHGGKDDSNHSPILTYDDHRMAMAFAPLALVLDNIMIENPDVVNKSYPTYWEDIKKVGFLIA